MTQEQLAQHMGVSRQTVSKWESGQAPELGKLLELSDLFSCKLDDLLRQDLSMQASPIRIVQVGGFRSAQYILISPNAQTDIRRYLQTWAGENQLDPQPLLLWSFPHLSPELKDRFRLTGFAAALVLPEDLGPLTEGPRLTRQPDCHYALLSFPEPGGRDPAQINRGIQTVLAHLRDSGIPKAAREDCIPCFERRYEKDGIPYVDLFLQCSPKEPAEYLSLL